MTFQFYPYGYAPSRQLPPTLHPDGTRFAVSLDFADTASRIRSNAWALLDGHRLVPPERAVALYRLALLAYAADTRIPRHLAYNRWERDLILHVPVTDPAAWSAAGKVATDLLSFLTGDHWQIEFFQSTRSRPRGDAKLWRKGARPDTDVVSLFSGGLDSLIGASDLLAAGTPPVLVGHCDSPSTAAVQKRLLKMLGSRYPATGPLLQFWIRPPHLIGNERENTTRGRSFLFFALAALVASSLGDHSRLIVPENGFIALNAPLTPTRLGSLSTRTVHPYTMTRLRELLRCLALPVTVETPYTFVTKGEMLDRATDREFVLTASPESMSCAHPSAGRYRKVSPFKHCGTCVPCIIRRAALHRIGQDDGSAYHTDVLKAGRETSKLEDMRAFLAAIERRHLISPAVAVLRSGPIPPAAGRVADYASIYIRGLDEVETFVRGRKTRRL